MAISRKIKILHYLWWMDYGGIQAWLIETLRRLDPDEFQVDFMFHINRPGYYDKEIISRGSHISYVPPARKWEEYGRKFAEANRNFGPYDILHVHSEPAGKPMYWAKKENIPVRMVMSHNEHPEFRNLPPWKRRAWLPITRSSIYLYATHGHGVSEEAARGRFGAGWKLFPRWSVFHLGIPLEPFKEAKGSKASIRKELGIPANVPILGHIGRLTPEKNHQFLLEIAASLQSKGQNFRLVFIGDGRLKDELERKVAAYNLGDKIIFAGFRPDVPRLLRGLDLLVFPSPKEGLPLSVLEAEASGVKCLLSDSITKEVDVIPELIKRVSLKKTANQWSEALLDHLHWDPRLTPQQCWDKIAQSEFNIDHCMVRLANLYRSSLGLPEREANKVKRQRLKSARAS